MVQSVPAASALSSAAAGEAWAADAVATACAAQIAAAALVAIGNTWGPGKANAAVLILPSDACFGREPLIFLYRHRSAKNEACIYNLIQPASA